MAHHAAHDRHGFIVAVAKELEISRGEVLFGRGEVLFRCRYVGLVFRPMNGQVVDAVVKSVSKVGACLASAYILIFVTGRHLC